MDDDIINLKEDTTLGDYLKSMRETWDVLTWYYAQFVNQTAREYLRRMLFWSACSRVTSLTYPWFMGLGIAGLINHNAHQAFVALIGIWLSYMFGALFEWRAGHHIELTLGENIQTMERRLNELFFEKDLGLHLEEGSKLTMENLEKGWNRFDAVQKSLLFGAVDAGLSFFISFVMLCVLSPVCGGIVFLILLANVWLSLHLNRFVMVAIGPVESQFRALHRRRGERWLGVERVVTSGRYLAEVEEMDQGFRQALKDDRQIWLTYIRRITPRSLFSGFAVAATGVWAGWRVWSGEMDAAALIPILTWAGMATQQIRFLARAEREINFCTPSLKSLRDALTLPVRVTEPEDAIRLPDGPVRVEVCGVSHRYFHARSKTDGGEMRVLQGLDFTIEPGEKVALIGPSGAGKSTVTRLLQRYMDPERGSIRVNGHDLRELHLDSWRRLVGYIPQRPQVFDGTLKDNLLYALTPDARAAITDEKIWEVMRLLRVDFGARLTHGLETRVGRNGVKLSGGEAQRVMIAAAALKRPRFMIIDEATSSLDAENQAAVQTGLESLLTSVDASALIIAHRLSTVLACDTFVVLRAVATLDNGNSQIECIAHSPTELFAASPTFRRLAQLEGVHLDAA
ncbi:ABC transporter ATP-binding protein [Candidatus Uhrbacteria bacterium]|nr:ABC transporter ATP-binding protein [Candidatus Uhrbacteria bacterium]